MEINHRNHPQPGKIDDLITRLQDGRNLLDWETLVVTGDELYEAVGYLLSYRDLLRRAYTESLHKRQLEKFERDHYE